MYRFVLLRLQLKTTASCLVFDNCNEDLKTGKLNYTVPAFSVFDDSNEVLKTGNLTALITF